MSVDSGACYELLMRRIVLEERPDVGIEMNRMPLRLLTASDHLEDVTAIRIFSILHYISDTLVTVADGLLLLQSGISSTKWRVRDRCLRS